MSSGSEQSFPVAETFVVGDWEVDPGSHRIRRGTEEIRLEPRTIAVLVRLAGQPGATVSRGELERDVWQDAVVGYDALSNAVAKLRRAFGDNTRHPRIIETVPKVGYRLIATVTRLSPTTATDYEASDPQLERKLAVIVYADVAGYSRLTGQDEEGTHRSLRACLEAMTALVGAYSGRVVHFAGDAVLADFPTVSEAIVCAVTVQSDIDKLNSDVPEIRKVRFRIGVNLGEVIVDRDDIYGDGVNVAARLESLAEPGGVCISGSVYDAIGQKLPLDYEYLGEQRVKNIALPVRAYRARTRAGMRLPKPAPARQTRIRPRLASAVMAAAALAIVATVTAVLWQHIRPPEVPDQAHPSAVAPVAGRPTLAVLPFANLTDELSREHFADGMTDDLITDLSKVSGLFVIGRHSVFSYKDVSIDPAEIAEELGVRFLVQGSVRGNGGKMRINVQLVDARTGGQVWAERYDGSDADVFALQDRVVGKIVSALAVELTESERANLSRRPTDHLEAYDNFLRAERRRIYGEGGQRYQQAMALYRKAIALDPEFADAHAGLAETAYHVWRWDQTGVMPGDVARKLAYDSAGRALELDPDNPRAYGIMAMLQVADGRHALALQSAEQAVAFDPNDARAYRTLASVLIYSGHPAEALRAMETAIRLDPKPTANSDNNMAWVLTFNSRYDEAIELYERAREAGGATWPEELVVAYGAAGRIDEGAHALDNLYERIPFANIAYFRARHTNYKRPADLDFQI